MPGWVIGAAVVAVLVAGVAHTARDSEQAKAWERGVKVVMGAQRKAYQDTTAQLRDSLLFAWTEKALAEGRAATAVKAVAPARVVTVEKKAALPVVDAGRDSGLMIRARDEVIAAQDTLLERQDRLVVALTDVIRADSGVARLYVRQRDVDSLRIGALETALATRPRASKLLGFLPRPKVKCGIGAGLGASPSGTNVQAGPIAGCILTY